MRAPAAVAASCSARAELAAPSARYAVSARRRYQRAANQMPSRPSTPHAPSSGSSAKTAPRMNSAWTPAMRTSGPASRRVAPTAATSVVPRVIRSPVPARSTTGAGSASTRSANCSRMRARVRSPKRCPTWPAQRTRRSCASAKTRMVSARRSTAATPPPALTSSMMRPSSHGPTSPAPAASALRPITAAKTRASSRISRSTARRIRDGSAMGRAWGVGSDPVVIARPPGTAGRFLRRRGRRPYRGTPGGGSRTPGQGAHGGCRRPRRDRRPGSTRCPPGPAGAVRCW